jgi:iron complex transport system substrate-binding protein
MSRLPTALAAAALSVTLVGPVVGPVAVRAASTPPDAGNPPGCVDGADAGDDLFADQFVVRHAENFTLDYADTYKVLRVGAVGPDAAGQTWVLVQCGTTPPELTGDLDGAELVEIPVSTIYSESTSHAGFLDVLGLAGRVTGVANGDWVVMPSLRERIDAGEVASFAATGQIDVEQVIAADPAVYLTGGYDDPAHRTLRDAGIPVVANAEWLETSPQGWAEWVGVFAALTNTEATANELVTEWLAGYDDAAALAADVVERPTVITGDLYEGTWYASGGGGVAARFIADAGADYVFGADPGSAAQQLDIETVLAEGADAEFWLNPTSLTSQEQAIEVDSRYGQFAAWTAGGVWTNIVAPDPTVSFIEQGPVMIDAYLLDYIKVFHPELVPDHELVFLTPLATG